MPEPTMNTIVPQPYQNNPNAGAAAAAVAAQGIPKHLLPFGHPGRKDEAPPQLQSIHVVAEGAGKQVSAASFPGMGGVLMIVESEGSISCCWVNKPA